MSRATAPRKSSAPHAPHAPRSNPAQPPRASAAAPGPLPATGVVLIGTAATVRAMSGQLACLAHSCIPVGCILVERLSTRAGSPEIAALGVLPPILGYLDELIDLQARYQFKTALVSIPGTLPIEQRRTRALLRQLQVPERFIPSFEDVIAPTPASLTYRSAPPALDPAQLIGRTHYGLNRQQVAEILRGKRVLITGAGGSIGSELARVCAGFDPECVILMERAENALFEIDHQIARRFPSVARKAVMHDIVEADQTARLLAQLKPHVVFHSAAHKHVPLMEDHPSHAVNNNLFGTRAIADAALAAGVERFVMISSDKAVNPTSVMGATKRLAEIYISGLARRSADTRFSMVRFGNVLASACSVIPIWSQQLADGDPITVTDPRMTRFFMTIPEAATLVVQAAALDQDRSRAPVYVLDMGEPIRILDLAIRFARACGFDPRIDASTIPAAARKAALPEIDDEFDAATLPIIFTGARPGEKLYEELAYSAENLKPTSHPGINQWSSATTGDSESAVAAMVADFELLRRSNADRASVVAAIARHVPEMRRAAN